MKKASQHSEKNSPPIRLQAWLAQSGVASRRACERLMVGGRVTVNGQPATELGSKVDPRHDVIQVDGQRIERAQPRQLYLFYKPRGVISTMRRGREQGRSITEVVHLSERVFPVGRLDADSEGLMLLTNDGQLALRLSHPRFEHEKEYEVQFRQPISESHLLRLRQPFIIEGYRTRPATVQKINPKAVRIILREGRHRQIRHMSRQLRLTIQSLKRIRVGSYRLGTLKPGEYRKVMKGSF